MKTIQELIDTALVRPERERSGKFNPSSFGYCFRNQYWNRKDEPKSNPPDERTLRVFKAGNIFEEFVVSLLLVGTDHKYETQVKVESADVLGYADLVSENEVIDIKSQHSKSFWWVDRELASGGDIKQIKYSNWLQVMYYARELKKPFGHLVFISKDDLCIKEFAQPLDQWWEEELASELFNLRHFWDAQQLPEAVPRCEPKQDKKTGLYSFWQCDYCAWKDKCWKMENYIICDKQVEKETENGEED